MVSMVFDLAAVLFSMPVDVIGRIVPKPFQGDVALYDSNDASGTYSVA